MPTVVNIDEESVLYETALQFPTNSLYLLYVKALEFKSTMSGNLYDVYPLINGQKHWDTNKWNAVLNTQYNGTYTKKGEYFSKVVVYRIMGKSKTPGLTFRFGGLTLESVFNNSNGSPDTFTISEEGPTITTRFMSAAKSSNSPVGSTSPGQQKTVAIMNFRSYSPSVIQEITGLILGFSSSLSNFSATTTVYSASSNSQIGSAITVGTATTSVNAYSGSSVVFSENGSETLVVKSNLNASVTGVPYSIALKCYGYKLKRGSDVYNITLDTPITFGTLVVE